MTSSMLKLPWNFEVLLLNSGYASATIIVEAEGKRGAMGEYMRAFKCFFQNELKDGKTLHTDAINAEEGRIKVVAFSQNK